MEPFAISTFYSRLISTPSNVGVNPVREHARPWEAPTFLKKRAGSPGVPPPRPFLGVYSCFAWRFCAAASPLLLYVVPFNIFSPTHNISCGFHSFLHVSGYGDTWKHGNKDCVSKCTVTNFLSSFYLGFYILFFLKSCGTCDIKVVCHPSLFLCRWKGIWTMM